MMKNNYSLYFVMLIIVLTACIVSTGCTSAQKDQTPLQTTTTSLTQNPTAASVITAASLAPTITSTTIIATTPTLPNGGITVTINSVETKTVLGTVKPINASAFLVLDVTIQNNDKNNDFVYTPASFQIIGNNLGPKWRTSSNYKFPSGLNNQLTSGTIPLKSKTTGQIVFGVSGNSNSYTFSISDASGSEIAKIENIIVP